MNEKRHLCTFLPVLDGKFLEEKHFLVFVFRVPGMWNIWYAIVSVAI